MRKWIWVAFKGEAQEWITPKLFSLIIFRTPGYFWIMPSFLWFVVLFYIKFKDGFKVHFEWQISDYIKYQWGLKIDVKKYDEIKLYEKYSPQMLPVKELRELWGLEK